MDQSVDQSQIDAAMGYESLLVPGLFVPWPAPVLAAANFSPGCDLLDIACGTGIVARRARESSDDGHIVGIDADAGMIEVANRLQPDVQWDVGLAESLPYDDNRFDAVTIQFGMMFFQDRVKALREALRVLKPGGRMAVTVWNGLEAMPAYQTQVNLLQEHCGTQAADALRAPFCLGDRKYVETLLGTAGAENVSAETRSETADFPSIAELVESELTGWLPIMGVNLSQDQISTVMAVAEDALAPYRSEQGRLVYETSAHLISGAKPG